jgi:NAD-dependent deacetylase
VNVPQAVVDAVAGASHVCVLTGAGVSAESGVPTFRDAQSGLWAKYNPQDLATPTAFEDNPELVWRWYRWRRQLVSGVSPNAGHYALVELAARKSGFTLITQNVDGLHHRAGSDKVVEYHGNLFANRCFQGDCDISGANLELPVPRCPQCGGNVRPGVVWFGEPIPPAAMDAASAAANSCDVFLSVGTSAAVWPAAGLAEAAQSRGAAVVEINLDPTPLSTRSQYRIAGKSGEILPALVARLAG